MDTWQADQIKRMQVGNCICVYSVEFTVPHQLGGNAPFRQFLVSYTPTDQGGYNQGMSAYDTYHCWAASQYRDKVRQASHFKL